MTRKSAKRKGSKGDSPGGHGNSGSSPEKLCPPSKASKMSSEDEPSPILPSFSSSLQLSNYITDNLQNKLSTLSPSLQTVVECISSVIFSLKHDNSSLIQQIDDQGSEIVDLKSEILNQSKEIESLKNQVKHLNEIIHFNNDRFKVSSVHFLLLEDNEC